MPVKRAGSARGITLMELMVAVALTSVVVLASVKVDQLSRSQAFRTAERAAQQHRGRVALQHLRERVGLGAKTGLNHDPSRWGTSVEVLSLTSMELQLCEFQSADPNDLNDLSQYRRIRYQFDDATKRLLFSVSATTNCTTASWSAPQVLLEGVDQVTFSRPRKNMVRLDLTLKGQEQTTLNTDIFLQGATALPTDASLQTRW